MSSHHADNERTFPVMSDERAFSFAFQRVKPTCLKLLSNGTVEDVDYLLSVLQELDNDSLNFLQAYLIFPMRFLMSKKVSEKMSLKCLEFIAYYFNRSPVQTFSTFSNIFRELFTSLTVVGDIEKLANCSEEFKISICRCTVSLIKNSKEEIINELYSLDFRLPLAHSLFVLTSILKTEKSKLLRISALEAIGALTYNELCVKSKHESSKKLASQALASYFPGLTITLQCVICGDFKQGKDVLTLALNILGDLIILVIGDSCQISDTKNIEENDSVPNVIKNAQWYKTVSEKMNILLQNVSVGANHEHWKVRLQFLQFTESLLFKCSKHLDNCFSLLIPPVLTLSVDDYPDIALYGKKIISALAQKLEISGSVSLRSVIEDNIYSTTSKLIKCKLLADDKIKLFTLKTLQGYLTVLGSNVSNLLLSRPHLERIMLCLINFLEIDTTALNMIEEVSAPVNFDVTVPNLWPKKNFVCFQSDEILKVVKNITSLLAKFGNARLIMHYLLEKMQNSPLYSLQCILLIGNIIQSLSIESSVFKPIELINDVLEELLSPAIWDVPVQDLPEQYLAVVNTEKYIALPAKVHNNNVLQMCLILEAIAKSAEVLKHEFRSFLIKILCPVMEKAGSSSYVLSQSGKVCLYSIAHFCDYESVSELIKDNADYITNSITIHFCHFLHKPEVAVVLRVAMEESDAAALVLFRDSINQILKLIDLNQDKAYPLLTILFSAINCIKKWFPSKKQKLQNSSQSKNKDLKSSILKYISSKSTDFDSYDDNIAAEPNDENFNSEQTDGISEIDQKKPLPLHVTITTDVLKRCIHFQSSRNLYLRILALETAQACMIALIDHEDQLHPLVHEFWNPFVPRFAEDVIVVIKAFEVLIVIADECRDFVRVRTLKDVFPKLLSFLKKEYKCSLKSNFRNYQWTNAHKLQLLILSEIGNLCIKLEIGEKDLAVVAEVCLNYLSIEQPTVLQKAAEKTLKSLSEIDADAIWFYYNEFYCQEKSLNPPHESLSVIHFPNSNGSNTSIKLDF